MSVKPWMPIYWGDYLRDTTHLSAAEHGAYLLLIGQYWQTECPIADNDEYLRRTARMEKAEWRKSRKTLEAFFIVADGVWRHARIDAEILAWGARKEKSVERAERAAAARWAKKPASSKDANSNAPSMPEALPDDVLDQCPSSSSALPNGKAYSGADAPADETVPAEAPEEKAADPIDLKAQMWRVARAYLLKETRLTTDRIGSLVGKWRKVYDDVEIINALAAAQAECAANPIEYIEACLIRSKRNGTGNQANRSGGYRGNSDPFGIGSVGQTGLDLRVVSG